MDESFFCLLLFHWRFLKKLSGQNKKARKGVKISPHALRAYQCIQLREVRLLVFVQLRNRSLLSSGGLHGPYRFPSRRG